MKANLHLLFFLLFLPFFANSQLQDLYPTRSSGFYCSCSGDGQQPYPARYRKLSHFIKDPATNERVIIGNSCLYIEDFGLTNVAADNGVSYFEIVYYCPRDGDPFANLDDPNFHLNEFYDENGNLLPPDNEANGIFSVEHREAERLVLKYEHPKKLPDGKTKVVNPWFGFISFEIAIYHPPVAMIHGLWADRSSFDAMETHLNASGNYEPWQLYKIDYKSSNDQYFQNNSKVVPTGINQLLGQCRDNFMAVSKANVVCHSMGGILTRQFVQSSSYVNHKSINKIITCNTPHAGSQMANWLLDAPPYSQTYTALLLNEMGKSCFHGAVSDLRVSSGEINSMQSYSPVDPVKVHAINTVQPHTASYYGFFVGPGIPFIFFQTINWCGSNYITDIFDSTDSDLVVALESQAGGLSGLPTELYSNQVHTGSVANAQVMNAVLEKLKLENTAPEFADHYNANYLSYSVGSNCLFNTNQPQKEARNAVVDLQITSPTIGQNVVAGSDLTINFSSSDIDSVVAFLQNSYENFAIRKVKYSENTFTLPTDISLLGPVKLVLAGYSATNQLLTSTSVTYNQTTNATLNSIYTYPSSVYLHQNDSLVVSIYGKYSDNIDRNITNDPNLNFSFLLGNASKMEANIVLNNPVNDTLTITYGSPAARIAADPIQLVVNTLDQTQAPLPVRLLSFSGKNTENGNLLEWKTAQETNFSHFEIEKSLDGKVFKKIGKKDGNASENYKFTDRIPPSGRSDVSAGELYRLKLVDLDGKHTFSKIIFIKIEQESEISVSPNPYSDKIKITNNQSKILTIRLLGTTGNQIESTINSSAKEIIFPVKNMPTGLYFLEINEGRKKKVLKLLKE